MKDLEAGPSPPYLSEIKQPNLLANELETDITKGTLLEEVSFSL
jgi:hypothetical protein